MIAMLPAGVVTVLSWIGVKSSAGPAASVARVLAPAARPMLVLAAISLIGAALRCGRGPTSLAVVAGTALYLSMYVLPVGSHAGMAGMADMTAHTGANVAAAAARAGARGRTNSPVFYVGVIAFVGTFSWSALRRHHGSCHTLIPVLGR